MGTESIICRLAAQESGQSISSNFQISFTNLIFAVSARDRCAVADLIISKSRNMEFVELQYKFPTGVISRADLYSTALFCSPKQPI